jgi:hypothetical protein
VIRSLAALGAAAGVLAVVCVFGVRAAPQGAPGGILCVPRVLRTPTPAAGATPTPSATPACTFYADDPYEAYYGAGNVPAFDAQTLPYWRANVLGGGAIGANDAQAAFAVFVLGAEAWTPTATATAVGSLAQAIYDDTTGAHDACLSTEYAVDFKDRGRLHSGKPADATKGDAWIGVEEACGGQVATNAAVELRNVEAWAYLSDGTWVRYAGGIYGAQEHDLQPFGGAAFAPQPGEGGPVYWLRPGDGIEVYTSSVDLPAGTVALATRFEARLVEKDIAGVDDLDAARLLVDAGADWKRADFSIPGDAFVGRFSLVGRAWQWVYGSSLDVATLTAHPPPW